MAESLTKNRRYGIFAGMRSAVGEEDLGSCLVVNAMRPPAPPHVSGGTDKVLK